jgi:hypothetical protein
MFVGFDTLGAHQNGSACFSNHDSSLLEVRFPVSERSFVRVTNFHTNNFGLSTFTTFFHDNLQAKNSAIYPNYNLKYVFRGDYATTV